MFPPAARAGGLGDWLSPAPGAATQADALRQALSQGTTQAVASLGRVDGYFANPRVRIPLPDHLRRVERGLRAVGQGPAVDEFSLSLNRAAETAAPEAKTVFLDVVRGLTIQDAVGIVRGPDDAATRYLRGRAGPALHTRFAPIVARATDQVGVTARYKKLMRKASLAGALDLSGFDLDSFVTTRALDGLFLLIGDEEKRIRRDPAARTTELLKKVFR